VNILETLLANEAEVDGQTICGRTALHFSVLKEFTKGIGLLMDYEADPNLQVNCLNIFLVFHKIVQWKCGFKA